MKPESKGHRLRDPSRGPLAGSRACSVFSSGRLLRPAVRETQTGYVLDIVPSPLETSSVFNAQPCEVDVI